MRILHFIYAAIFFTLSIMAACLGEKAIGIICLTVFVYNVFKGCNSVNVPPPDDEINGYC